MNSVYIAKSLDGFIAGANGEIDWLESIANPDNNDMGYHEFMERIDALVMGRNTFELVNSFDIEWPYVKPVFVLSTTLNEIPKKLRDKVFLTKGSLQEVIAKLKSLGHHRLYIDGGKTIQSFLKEDLIDEMIITTFPILLGQGIPLFSNNDKVLTFKHVKSKVFLNALTQDHYIKSKTQ